MDRLTLIVNRVLATVDQVLESFPPLKGKSLTTKIIVLFGSLVSAIFLAIGAEFGKGLIETRPPNAAQPGTSTPPANSEPLKQKSPEADFGIVVESFDLATDPKYYNGPEYFDLPAGMHVLPIPDRRTDYEIDFGWEHGRAYRIFDIKNRSVDPEKHCYKPTHLGRERAQELNYQYEDPERQELAENIVPSFDVVLKNEGGGAEILTNIRFVRSFTDYSSIEGSGESFDAQPLDVQASVSFVVGGHDDPNPQTEKLDRPLIVGPQHFVRVRLTVLADTSELDRLPDAWLGHFEFMFGENYKLRTKEVCAYNLVS